MNWTRARFLGATVLVGVGVVSLTQFLARHREAAQVHTTTLVTNDAAALQERVRRLEAEHTRLVAAVQAATAENRRLETASQQADRAAQLYQELAQQAPHQDTTNPYPTLRHALVGVGKQMRKVAEMNAQWAGVDEDKLSPAEQQALNEQGMQVVTEHLRLLQATAQMTGDTNAPITYETMPDYVACYLYGVLNLDLAQFSSISGVLQKYYNQAAQQGLLRSTNSAALGELNQSALAEIRSVLSPQQAAVLTKPPTKNIRLVTGAFSPSPGMKFTLQTN